MNKQTSLYEFGQNFLGPICSEYFFHIKEYCEKHQIDYLGFLAREGYLFQLIYQRLQQASLFPFVSSGYLYASRSFLFRLGLNDDISLDYSLEHGFSGSLRQLLVRRYGLSESQSESVFNNIQLEKIWILPDQKSELKVLLLSPKNKLEHLIKQTQDDYKLYIKTSGLITAKRPLLLDVGYSGTIQKLLCKMFQKDSHGLYFIATNPGKQKIQDNYVTMGGVFKTDVKMGGGYLMLDRSLFLEGLLTAPQGQFIDIHKHQGTNTFDFSFARKAYAQNHYHELNVIFDGAIDFVAEAFLHNIRYSTAEIEMLFTQFVTKRNMLPHASWPMFDVDDAISGNPNVNPLSFFGL
ncbi:MAG: hypothetical protein ACI936_003915 [Paraglaciecola sp.]|jgi:hypothetical protein